MKANSHDFNVADIYVTLPAFLVKSLGYRNIINTMFSCKGDPTFYHFKLNARPTKEVLNVWVVIGNKVRFKAKIFEVQPGGWKSFDDGRFGHAKYWLLCFDFERLPAPYEVKRGFQGFRYKQLN